MSRTDGLRQLVALVMCLMCLALAGTAADAARPALEAERVIPSELCRGLWLVPLTFDDGHVSLSLVLDTGASRTSIDPDALERVLGRRVRPGKKTTLRNGRIGPLSVGKLRVLAHEMDHIGRALGRAFDGILGVDTFADLLLTLDYPNAQIRVGRGDLDDDRAPAILRDIGRTRPHIELTIGDTRVPVLIDSGFSGGLTLRRDDVVEWSVPPRPVSASVRFSKVVVKSAGRVAHDARFGPFVIERPIVGISSGTRLLGAKALAGLSLTFDHGSKRIGIDAATDHPIRLEPLRGIGVAARPAAGGLELVRVFDETPAARAGLREGDLITAFDGVGVYEAGCDGVTRRYEAESVALTLSRDGSPLEIRVPVATLVP